LEECPHTGNGLPINPCPKERLKNRDITGGPIDAWGDCVYSVDSARQILLADGRFFSGTISPFPLKARVRILLRNDMIKDAAEDIVVEGDIQWTLKAMN